MGEDEIRTRVRQIIGAMAPQPVALPNSSLRFNEDLDYDSLALLELAVALEQEYHLPPLSEDEVIGLDTVGAVENLVVSRLLGVTG